MIVDKSVFKRFRLC